jgi:DNA-directed RNA polymerase subunit RPC12/RpoP
MKKGKYDRKVLLICPTCGENNFYLLEGMDESTELVKCAHCNRIITKDALIRENTESINEHIKEMGAEVLKDTKKEIKKMFKKAFRGNKYVRFK